MSNLNNLNDDEKTVIGVLCMIAIGLLVFAIGCGIITACLWVIIHAFKA